MANVYREFTVYTLGRDKDEGPSNVGKTALRRKVEWLTQIKLVRIKN